MEPVYFILVGGGIFIVISLIVRLAIGQKTSASIGESDGHNTIMNQSDNDLHLLHHQHSGNQTQQWQSGDSTASEENSKHSNAEGSAHDSYETGNPDSYSNSDNTGSDTGGSFSSDSSSSSDSPSSGSAD